MRLATVCRKTYAPASGASTAARRSARAHTPLVGRRALPAQIVDQRLTHDARQRQHGASTVLPGGHLDSAAAPVDVIQAQGGHLAGP